MANRSDDWMKQARADLRHAGSAAASESFEWSCFASQQAAEKAIKAVFLHLGMEAWGHTVRGLLEELSAKREVPPELIETGKILDKHYIPTRYPNGFDRGAPTDYYTRAEAEAAIGHAGTIIEWCASLFG